MKGPYAIVFAILLLHKLPAFAENIVYRCPGPPVVYSDALTPEEAKEKGCRAIEGAPTQSVDGLEQLKQARALRIKTALMNSQACTSNQEKKQPQSCEKIKDHAQRLACYDASTQARQQKDDLVTKIRSEVKKHLKDPDSANFGKCSVNKVDSRICIGVNSKNSYGGYTGEGQAIFVVEDGKLVFWRISDSTHEECLASIY